MVETPSLAVEGVTVKYGTFPVLDDVTFQAERGTLMGVVGPNGAGKEHAVQRHRGPAACGRRQDYGPGTVRRSQSRAGLRPTAGEGELALPRHGARRGDAGTPRPFEVAPVARPPRPRVRQGMSRARRHVGPPVRPDDRAFRWSASEGLRRAGVSSRGRGPSARRSVQRRGHRRSRGSRRGAPGLCGEKARSS